MNIEELAAERVELAEKIASTLERMMSDFKIKTGVAVRELEIEAIPQRYMDGSVHCLISQVDVQLDIQIAPVSGVGPTTLITFS